MEPTAATITCIKLTGTRAPRSVQLFKINGFDVTRDDGFAASTKASASGHDWVIDYYPAAWYSDNYWIMLRITLASAAGGGGGVVAASFAGRLASFPQHGRLGPCHVPTVSAELTKGQSREFYVMSRPELFRSGYVHDDTVLLELEITVLLDGDKPKEAAAVGATAAAPSYDLHRHFGELWRSQRGTDVTFVVAGERIAAHRCVLAARSPVFMAELFGDMKETASRSVVIEDVEPEVFRALMHFIYTDMSPPELEGRGEDASTMAQHLFAAADRYGMERLKLICEEKMCAGVSVGNVATALALAEQHGCCKLKARCMEFMVATPANVRAVVKTGGYKHLLASCSSVLSDLLVAVVQRYK
ncbi:unnamed protein product [Urochloa decumbens]|uniref:BTB domain-containing protein n=1 Tax=Urochloa decumbens TaxID=240449 RepID=A0ABC9EAX2_9POAL